MPMLMAAEQAHRLSATNEGGLKLTATGNLSRAVVAEMVEIVE